MKEAPLSSIVQGGEKRRPTFKADQGRYCRFALSCRGAADSSSAARRQTSPFQGLYRRSALEVATASQECAIAPGYPSDLGKHH
jgi:hypothetical protein